MTYHSQAQKAVQETAESTSNAMVTPEDQEKRMEASRSPLTSKREPLSSRAAPTKSSLCRFPLENVPHIKFGATDLRAWFGKLVGIARNNRTVAKIPAGTLQFCQHSVEERHMLSDFQFHIL